MKLATSPTREKYPLSRKKILKKTISRFILWNFLLHLIGGIFLSPFLIFVSSFFVRNVIEKKSTLLLFTPLIIYFIFQVTFFVLVYFYQRWYFAAYFYDLTDDLIIIRKGVITPSEITIPYERIQDIYVDQDILDRMFGLYDVHLSSATATSGMEAHIDGVEKPSADGLRAVLLSKIQQKISRAKGTGI